MTRQLPSTGIATSLQSEIIDHLQVGDYLMTIGSTHGICLSQASERSTLEAEPRPIVQIPPTFSRFQGRQLEVETAIAALKTNQIVVLSGAAGIGKSALLRHLAHHQQVTTSRPDGIIWLSQAHDLADLQQVLFDRLYRSTPILKPSEADLQQWLHGQQIILLIEDSQLRPEAWRQLQALLPNSACVVVSDCKLGEPQFIEIALTGLSWPDSLALVEQELGASPQTTLIEALWQLLQGHPQRLRQAAALVREGDMSLAKVVQKLQPDGRSLARLILSGLPKTQRWIVALLVAMRGVSLTAEQIAVMSGPPNPQASLQALLQRYLIQLDHHRYCLAASLVEPLQADFDAGPWMERALAHVLPWAEQHRQRPAILVAEQAVILHTLEWAIACERWADVLRLVRAIESALSLQKQWHAWEQVLQWGLQAAWALEDAAAEAWALHQLGTRALCLEQVTTAYDALSQALTLRHALSDVIASQVTQNNLNLLKQLTLPRPRRSRHRVRVYLTLGLIGLMVFGLSVLVSWTIVNQFSQPSPKLPPTTSSQS